MTTESTRVPPLKPNSSHAPTVVISNLWPAVEGGRYAIKRIVGEPLQIWVDIFKDGHDQLDAAVKWRRQGVDAWEEQRMTSLENDRWTATFAAAEMGTWEYTVEAWKDDYKTWLHDFERKVVARTEGETLATEILEGSLIIEDSARIADKSGNSEESRTLKDAAVIIRKADAATALKLAREERLCTLMAHWTNREYSTSLAPKHRLQVERERARFSAWYEFFPRGAEGRSDKHSTFRDCLPRIEYAKEMGFDVIYFPPIHPIGRTFRKGKDNSLTAEPDDVGSPWAIGNEAGGHKSVAPELGTIEDFTWLVAQANKLGVEIALDFAIQCSPDHPYVKEHPEWFFQRPDGTIKYAENPPKKYQDIYPINFHCENWQELWKEMVDIVLFWVDKGVKIFRVDNPHTKPVAFWEYLISEVRLKHPDVLFLAEAFTRPRMMEMLGKIGFSQSYTYFTWRTHKHEIREYVEQLTKSEMHDYYRGNFWPNTPDILVPPLVDAPPAAFKVRAALAATLSSNWGIYSGLEFCENQQHPDRDEYRQNEKYELKDRDWDAPGNIKVFLRQLNEVRNSHPAFREYTNIFFCDTTNDQMLAYAKKSSDGDDVVVVVINLDPHNEQSGDVILPLEALQLQKLAAPNKFKVEDLLDGATYTWSGHRNWVSLNPANKTVHLLQVHK